MLFLAFVVRPLAVLTAAGLAITWKERFLMMTLSARGVVTAATAPIFGLALVDKGMKGADEIVPVVFLVVAGTVLISAILSPLVAKRLGMLGQSGPSIFFIGAPRWAVALGSALGAAGIDLRVWALDSAEIGRAKAAGVSVSTKPINPRDPDRITGLDGVALVAIATSDDAFNQLFAYEMSEALEPDQVYRSPGPQNALEIVRNAGRLIRTDVDIDEIEVRVEAGQQFVILDPEAALPDGAVPLLVLETTKNLGHLGLFFYCDRPDSPRRRVRRVVALVP